MPSEKNLYDTDVLHLLASGDSNAFRQIYDNHVKFIYRLAKRFGPDDFADDVVQEVFTKLWQKKRELGNVNDLRAYFFMWTRNFIYNQLEQQTVKAHAYQEYLALKDDKIDNVESPLVEEDLNALVQRACPLLPEHLREVFWLAKVEGLSHEDIAKKLNMPKLTVKSYIRNSLKLLRKKISPHVGFDMYFLLVSLTIDL
jgi:RNA polymerase sigma-70 factor (ECF subfamily)